jgi:LacI family repressor for deo operon, udp, cdd, tsx, nupC, and nupG
MAMATLKVAREMNIHVPSELSVIGFSNMAVTEHLHPSLTTIDQSFVEIGRVAIEMLMKLTQQKPLLSEVTSKKKVGGNNTSENNSRKLPTTLIVRESTAPPKR